MGLRERKRRATRLAIEHAAVDLSLDRGIAGVTIEEIARRADVSSRTFFNHFASKEDALLGDRVPAELDLDITGTTAVEVLAQIEAFTVRMFTGFDPDPDLIRKRHALFATSPELAVGEMGRLAELEEALVRQVAGALAAQSRPEVSQDDARMIVMLAGAAMRFAVHRWMTTALDAMPTDTIGPAFDELRRVARAIANDPGEQANASTEGQTTSA